MLSINTNGQHLEITASPDTKLTRLSYALQAALAWFVGQGMHRVAMERQKSHDGTCKITVTSDLQPSADIHSVITDINELARAGLLEKHIADRDRWADDVGSATLLRPRELRATLTLADLAFGVADMVVFMFQRRVTSIRWQLARSEMQLWATPRLRPSELREIGKSESDYNPLATVSSLPVAG